MVTMTICLMSNSRLYGNECALEALLNKTNLPFLYNQACAGRVVGSIDGPISVLLVVLKALWLRVESVVVFRWMNTYSNLPTPTHYTL